MYSTTKKTCGDSWESVVAQMYPQKASNPKLTNYSKDEAGKILSSSQCCRWSLELQLSVLIFDDSNL